MEAWSQPQAKGGSMLYNIITQEVNSETEKIVSSLALRRFRGFSISKQKGHYQGKVESSLCLAIDTLSDDNRLGVLSLAKDIKDVLNQDCVLLQSIESNSKLI